MDERVYGDTILRVERISNDTFVVSDIWLYNSSCIFMASSFKQRYSWLETFLKAFHLPIFSKLIHKSSIGDISVRGYESYSANQGDHGSYEDISMTVIRTEIPDVYTIEGKEGYIYVPDLKTSVFLRSKGQTFNLRCGPRDGNWQILEDIPELK
jgi:hypothetical protein